MEYYSLPLKGIKQLIPLISKERNYKNFDYEGFVLYITHFLIKLKVLDYYKGVADDVIPYYKDAFLVMPAIKPIESFPSKVKEYLSHANNDFIKDTKIYKDLLESKNDLFSKIDQLTLDNLNKDDKIKSMSQEIAELRNQIEELTALLSHESQQSLKRKEKLIAEQKEIYKRVVGEYKFLEIFDEAGQALPEVDINPQKPEYVHESEFGFDEYKDFAEPYQSDYFDDNVYRSHDNEMWDYYGEELNLDIIEESMDEFESDLDLESDSEYQKLREEVKKGKTPENKKKIYDKEKRTLNKKKKRDNNEINYNFNREAEIQYVNRKNDDTIYQKHFIFNSFKKKKLNSKNAKDKKEFVFNFYNSALNKLYHFMLKNKKIYKKEFYFSYKFVCYINKKNELIFNFSIKAHYFDINMKAQLYRIRNYILTHFKKLVVAVRKF